MAASPGCGMTPWHVREIERLCDLLAAAERRAADAEAAVKESKAWNLRLAERIFAAHEVLANRAEKRT